jgi:hypothetical protein
MVDIMADVQTSNLDVCVGCAGEHSLASCAAAQGFTGSGRGWGHVRLSTSANIRMAAACMGEVTYVTSLNVHGDTVASSSIQPMP